MFDYARFFEQNKNGVLATIDGAGVKTRMFQYLWAEDGKVYFCTGGNKEVFKQLEKNPHASFCSHSPNLEVVSVDGMVVFADSPEMKRRIFDNYPAIGALYKAPDNPVFRVFYLDVDTVETFNFSEGSKYWKAKQ